MASYPNLCQNLCDGFPLGNMPNLQYTIIIPNNPSCFMYSAAVDTYLQEEVEASHISGPFPKEEVEHILCGSSSPLRSLLPSRLKLLIHR